MILAASCHIAILLMDHGQTVSQSGPLILILYIDLALCHLRVSISFIMVGLSGVLGKIH
jgi:hypothetical protein